MNLFTHIDLFTSLMFQRVYLKKYLVLINIVAHQIFTFYSTIHKLKHLHKKIQLYY